MYSVSNKSTSGLICSGCTSIEDVIRQQSGIEKLTLETIKVCTSYTAHHDYFIMLSFKGVEFHKVLDLLDNDV